MEATNILIGVVVVLIILFVMFVVSHGNHSEEPKEPTLLEKFEQGWEIDRDGVKAVDVRMSKTWGGMVVIEWSSGVVGIYENNANLFKCTPPKERKTINVYMDANGNVAANTSSEEYIDVTKPIGYKHITTIHIEQNGEEWNVIK